MNKLVLLFDFEYLTFISSSDYVLIPMVPMSINPCLPFHILLPVVYFPQFSPLDYFNCTSL